MPHDRATRFYLTPRGACVLNCPRKSSKRTTLQLCVTTSHLTTLWDHNYKSLHVSTNKHYLHHELKLHPHRMMDFASRPGYTLLSYTTRRMCSQLSTEEEQENNTVSLYHHISLHSTTSTTPLMFHIDSRVIFVSLRHYFIMTFRRTRAGRSVIVCTMHLVWVENVLIINYIRVPVHYTYL